MSKKLRLRTGRILYDYVGKTTYPLDCSGGRSGFVAGGSFAGGLPGLRAGRPANFDRDAQDRDPVLAEMISRFAVEARLPPQVVVAGAAAMSLCLVTGGAGFIGSSLARALIARGDRVRVIDNFSSGKRENLADIADQIELVEGDILDDRALGARHQRGRVGVSRGGDPLGAEVDGRADREPRRQRHRHVARARSGAPRGDSAARLRRVVGRLRRRSAAPQGRDDAAGADLALRRRRSWRASSTRRSTRAPTALETVCLRYFNVFGPRQDPASEYAAVIPKFITSALAGKQPRIFGDGSQSRDFCYIDNIIEANFKAAGGRRGRRLGRRLQRRPAARRSISIGWSR